MALTDGIDKWLKQTQIAVLLMLERFNIDRWH
jgi:hypothetical protein